MRSNLSTSAILPPKPTVFHGRQEFVDKSVQLLTAPGTARLAILGTGGMGKTSVALALLHHSQVAEHFVGQRFFLSCEALVDADATVVALAKLLQLPPSNDLLTAVVTYFASGTRAVLALDNLETVWLAGGAPVAAVDGLLGRLARIPTLSLIITCRGTNLPQFVDWSNTDGAVLEPFSLDAALQTFQENAARQLTEGDMEIAKQLLDGVDRMPLAVSLLGQLARRRHSISELLFRWNSERTLLLRTHVAGRINNVDVSIKLSINMLDAADDSREALLLLSICCMLPDGLHRNVFEKLRPSFRYIDRARDNLSAYSLASTGAYGVLKTVSPVRHHVLQRHPPHPEHRRVLCSIYFDIARQLPLTMDEDFKERAAIAAPEMGNLSSLLLTLVAQPSDQVAEAVFRFTNFVYWQRPTATVALALLPYLDPYPELKAGCLRTIASTQIRLLDRRTAIQYLLPAMELDLELGNRAEAAWCALQIGTAHQLLGDLKLAEDMINEAKKAYAKLGDKLGKASCRMSLGLLMRDKAQYRVAIKHFSAARQTFNAFNIKYAASQCSYVIGTIYIKQRNYNLARGELEAARSASISVGDQGQEARSMLSLSIVYRAEGDLILGEQLLKEAQKIFVDLDDRPGLANCAYSFGNLRKKQGRGAEALSWFRSTHRLYVELLGVEREAQDFIDVCLKQIEELESKALPIGDSVQ